MLVKSRDINIYDLEKPILIAMLLVQDVFSLAEQDFIITSAVYDSDEHGRKSKHWSGLAVDIRGRHLPENLQVEILDTLKTALPDAYDVVYHSGTKHFHIEYDPKNHREGVQRIEFPLAINTRTA